MLFYLYIHLHLQTIYLLSSAETESETKLILKWNKAENFKYSKIMLILYWKTHIQ